MTTNTWATITAETIDSITALDLRSEAAEAIARGETVWHHRSSSPARCEVAYFPASDRAGIVYNADAEWGDAIVTTDAGGAPERFRLDLGGDDARRFVDEHGAGRCCYDGCDGTAHEQYVDGDGDWCCEEHYSKGFEYVEIVSEPANALTDRDCAKVFRDEMSERGWTVEVRGPRSGEAEGTYYRKSDGTLQILGYSLPVPESYRLDSERAYERSCR